MAMFSSLPPEILLIIFHNLPHSALMSTRSVSRQFRKASLPFLVTSFQVDCKTKHTLEKLQLFLEVIAEYRLGKHVKSILLDGIDNNSSEIATLPSLIVQLLSQATNIQQLAIHGHSSLLSSLHELTPHGRSTLEQSKSSLPIEGLVLDCSNLDSKALCAIIRSCRRLVNFKYLHTLPDQELLRRVPLNAQEIHEALLVHKETLKEIVVEDYFTQTEYNETPKFGSFEEFIALQKLSVESNALSRQVSLPLSLHSIAIKHCKSYEVIFVLLHLAKHSSVKAIQFDDADGGFALFFQRYQNLGQIRKDIQVHLVFPYVASAGLSNIVSYPLF